MNRRRSVSPSLGMAHHHFESNCEPEPRRSTVCGRAPTRRTISMRSDRRTSTYVSHVMIYALPANKVTPSQADRQWELRDATGALTDASSEGVKIG